MNAVHGNIGTSPKSGLYVYHDLYGITTVLDSFTSTVVLIYFLIPFEGRQF